jgi:hypothetical protein
LPFLIIIISTVYFIDNEFDENIEYLGIFGDIPKQRLSPGLNFDEQTENFMTTFGRFEILIKTITFGLFLGSCFYIWRSDRGLRNLKVKVLGPQKSTTKKYENIKNDIKEIKNSLIVYFRILSIIKKLIIGFMLFGSLILNYVNYFASGIEFGVKMCNLDMMWVNYLGLVFDNLKRLNGLYILILLFVGDKFRLLVEKRVQNCFKRKQNKTLSTSRVTAERQINDGIKLAQLSVNTSS